MLQISKNIYEGLIIAEITVGHAHAESAMAAAQNSTVTSIIIGFLAVFICGGFALGCYIGAQNQKARLRPPSRNELKSPLYDSGALLKKAQLVAAEKAVAQKEAAELEAAEKEAAEKEAAEKEAAEKEAAEKEAAEKEAAEKEAAEIEAAESKSLQTSGLPQLLDPKVADILGAMTRRRQRSARKKNPS